METKCTQAFANICRKLAIYFYEITPKKEVYKTVGNKDEDTGWINWGNQIFSELDENGTISLPISQTPVTLSEFNDAAYMFISELNENVLTYSDDMNKAVLRSFFGNDYMSILTPTREMLIKAGLVDEAILLDKFLYYNGLIYNLKSDGVFGEALGIERYREEVLSQTDATTKKEPPKKPQRVTGHEQNLFVKAIERGLMEKTDSGYRWLHNNGMKASLGYFLKRVFDPNGTTPIPYQRMENLFNVSRLDSAIDKALTAKKPQKWRIEIDALFND